jgi:hypothetical protein
VTDQKKLPLSSGTPAMDKPQTTSDHAREICGDLIPHTTSVRNAAVIADALKAKRLRALDEAADAVDYCCTVGDAALAVGKLMGKRGV